MWLTRLAYNTQMTEIVAFWKRNNITASHVSTSNKMEGDIFGGQVEASTHLDLSHS